MDLDPVALFARVPDVLQNLTWSMLKPERDCAATGAFVARVAHFKLEGNGDQNNYPLHELSAFIQGCSNVTLAGVSYGELADWFIYRAAVDSKALTSLVEEVGNGTCVLDYCKSYRFEGDPDLAGIGVSTSGWTFDMLWSGAKLMPTPGLRNIPPPSRRYRMFHGCISLQDLVSMERRTSRRQRGGWDSGW